MYTGKNFFKKNFFCEIFYHVLASALLKISLNFVREFFSLADLSLTFIFYYGDEITFNVHAKIKTKNIEESANYDVARVNLVYEKGVANGVANAKLEIIGLTQPNVLCFRLCANIT